MRMGGRRSPVTCPECGVILQYKYNLKRHWLNVHVPKELKCRPCKLHFASSEEAEEHRMICPKIIPLLKDLTQPAQGASIKMNFFDYDHPLMKIPSLDAPVKTPGQKKKRAKRSKWTLPLIPRRPVRTLNMVTRSHAKSSSNVLKLSESDSSDSEKEKRQPVPEASRSLSGDESDSTNEADVANTLLDDLQLSSDDESLLSDDTSDITALSGDEESAFCKPGEPLLQDSLLGKGYFWIQPAPSPSVIENFKNTSLSESTEVVITRFKHLCRDWSIDRACLMFVDKLKPLPIKSSVNLLEKCYRLFGNEVFVLEMNSIAIFGKIVMTLVLHFYKKSHYEVAGQLLRFLQSKPIDPFAHPPLRQREEFPLGSTTPEEALLVIMCCTIHLQTRETDLAVSFMMKALTEFIRKNNLIALDALKPVLHKMFNEMIKSQSNAPLLKLFKHIHYNQVDARYPVDLSFFYAGVLSSLVASSDQNEQKQAIDLFESVKASLMGSDSSEIPSRGLLIIAAEQRLPRAQLAKILMACVNKGAYPSYDFDNFSLKFLSSMSKIEMQVYLEQFIFYCAVRIKSGVLELKPCMELEVVVSNNYARNCKYPVHRRILNVNHTRDAALSRLYQVLRHCLDLPSSIPVERILQPYRTGKYIIFEGVVQQLFRHVLKVDDIENFEADSCIFCCNCI